MRWFGAVGAALIGVTLLPPVRAGEGLRPLLFTGDAGPKRYDLFALSSEGEPVNLSGSEAQEYDPVWSPDRSRIAYVSGTPDNRERRSDLWIMGADGKSRRQLTRTGQYVLAPNWCPDGKRILFSTINRPLAGTPEFGLRFILADGSDQGSLGSGLWGSCSPDGSKLLFTALDPKKNWETTVSVAAEDGSNPKSLLGKRTMMGAWSPDGKRIAYIGDGGGDQADLFTADADGGHKTQLTRSLEMESGPVWSADGRHLYFNRMTRDKPATCRIWSIDPAEKKPVAVQVTTKERMEIVGPVGFWSLGLD
jgi:TolB protein